MVHAAVIWSCSDELWPDLQGGREELHRDLWVIYHVFGEYKWIHLIIAEGLWETRAGEAMLFDEVKTCMLEGLNVDDV